MKILVVGGGGREHAIVRALARSVHAPELLCAPGNAGIAADVECLPGAAADDVEALVAGVSTRSRTLGLWPSGRARRRPRSRRS